MKTDAFANLERLVNAYDAFNKHVLGWARKEGADSQETNDAAHEFGLRLEDARRYIKKIRAQSHS